ncbi:MAG: MFS transporter [Planctomycetaceae bacterium]|jgi:MFS family permease
MTAGSQPTTPAPLYDRSFCCAFLSQIGFVLANTLMAHFSRWIGFLGADLEQTGFIMGAGAVISVFSRPWIGQWIDRFGARNIWFAGYAIFAAGSLINLQLTELNWMIYLCRGLIVLGAAFVFSSSLAYISNHAPPQRRTEAIGTLGIAGFIGMVLGPFVGDLLLSGDRSRASFDQLFLLGGGVLILPAVLLLFVTPLRNPPGQSSVNILEFARTVRKHWPGTVVLVLATFGICMNVPFVFLARFIDDSGLVLEALPEVTLFFICYSTSGITIRITARKVPDRFGRRKVLIFGTGMMGTGMLLFHAVSAQNPWTLMLPGFFCGAGHGLMFHTCTSLFLEPFPNASRGAGSALSLMVLDIGTISGATVMGELAAGFGYPAMFTVVAAACFLTGMIYTWATIPIWKARRLASAARSQP